MISISARAHVTPLALRSIAAGPIVAGLVLMGGSPAPALPDAPPTRTSFSYVSAPGEYVGSGEAQTFRPSRTTTVDVQGDGDFIAVDVQTPEVSWSADFAAGEGSTFRLGDFTHVEHFILETGRAPGIDVAPTGRSCGDYFGSFTIHQLAFDRDGQLTELDLSFDQRCQSKDAPSLTGTVLLNSRRQSYRMVSHDGDFVGQGERQTYLNDSSIIAATGTPAYVTATVSGHRDQWDMVFAAPTGEEFRKGATYATTRLGDDRFARLDVFGNGRGCGSSVGTLTIKEIFTASDGTVRNFAATFSQRCYDDTYPPLNGTLHYHA